jgi:general secretion pathway protein H
MKNERLKIQKPVHASRFTLHGLHGFTLLELIVVIFIISLAVTLIMPSLWVSDEHALKTEARHFSGTLRYIYDEAIGKKQTYVLHFNLDDQTWGFKSHTEKRSFKIKEDVRISDLVVPSHGKVSQGEFIMEIGPLGPEEPLTLHIKRGEAEYTVTLNHMNGRTKIYKGYTLL